MQAGNEVDWSWRATDCEGLVADAYWPNGTEPYGGPPPGWEEPGLSLTSLTSIFMYECQRFSWGPYERGPLLVGVEFYSPENVPPGCYEGDEDKLDRLAMLHAMWFSDEEIARDMNRSFGFRTHFASYEHVRDTSGPILQDTFTWQVDGQEASVLRASAPDAGTVGFPLTFRMYWFNETAVSYQDFLDDATVPQVPGLLAEGRMSPPTLYAESGLREYVGIGGYVNESELSGDVKRFRDFECQEPA